ncbi:deoxynucleoside kinase [Phaeodactylibacter sp.]|jgi:deoxyadenosine/deoxycytidine kinase|uniref:deoxynucleoside kinase n=1 Tax=Phaeodactylibacter sp. TaxID=1940289 RepID=UPI0025F9D14D|nr:deoxynucleoside kinase [Phaeodactylibacter sp.]MCI4648449.1 deoxynucleoside kinase [Phaeodactylibacter sp.]MCI5091013.1 deoxynucleoside kinase [Phaeodactylibacter sp.]
MNNDQSMQHQFLIIEGNIGAGKTTLSQMLAEDFGFKLLLEEFADNPFLPHFYQNPDRYAFPVELFFMTERHKQLQQELAQRDLFQEGIVADYIFYKTLLFARNNLNTEEYRLFQRLFNILNAAFPKPDLLVYLHRSVDRLMDNIRKRGRAFEQEIEPSYLQEIQQSYFEFFRSNEQLPILIIDIENLDFLNNPEDYQKILDLINRPYRPGLHRASFY